MLAHTNWGSEQNQAPPSSSVNISNRTVNNVIEIGTCHSGVKFGGDGILSVINANGGFSAIIGQWRVVGATSGFFLQRTIISGTLQVDAGTGFNVMSTDRIFDNQKSSAGIKTTVVFFEISDDISGVPVIDTATMTFESEQGSA